MLVMDRSEKVIMKDDSSMTSTNDFLLQRIRIPDLPSADFIAYGAGPGLIVVQQIQVHTFTPPPTDRFPDLHQLLIP